MRQLERLRVLSCCKGATAIEYALLGTLLAVALVGSLTLLGGEVQAFFDMMAGLF